MSGRLRLFVCLVASYGILRLALQGFLAGFWTVDAELLAQMLLVPVLQLVLLEFAALVFRWRAWWP